MPEQNIKTRLQLKTDTTENWSIASNPPEGRPFIPKKGEPIVYQDGKLSQLKIGNGIDTPENLPEVGKELSNDFSISDELVELSNDIEPNTGLNVISKIHRDETWSLSNKLSLHQVSGTNFVDVVAFLGGAGTVFSRGGITATVTDSCTLEISGTNETSDWVYIINKYHWSGEQTEKVYPAGTYTIPSGFMLNIRAAQYPDNVVISGIGGNLRDTVTIPEPFRIISLVYAVAAGVTINTSIPLGIFRGTSIPENFQYNGKIHTIDFANPVYEGLFDWTSGELKDIDGNTVAYYDKSDIATLPGTNYFWTAFGENTISNASKNLDKIILHFDEVAPEETVPSICDFVLTPTTMEAAYGLGAGSFLPNQKFNGNEVPTLTTKGTLLVKDAENNIKYSKAIEPFFNSRGVSDTLTHKGLEKKWSKKFYLLKDPVSITSVPPRWDWEIENKMYVWEFDESEFINTGIPAKIEDIPIVSACFINNDTVKDKISTTSLYNDTPYPAVFSYNAETGKYILTARGVGGSISAQLTKYSKAYFYYALEAPYVSAFNFALGIDAGDLVSFEVDLSDAEPYIVEEGLFQTLNSVVTDFDVTPNIAVLVPRSVEDAMDGMNNAARVLNMRDSADDNTTAQDYSWIGAGDGITDYTTQIQTKLDELHNISNGGTIHLGPGVYPINKSLIVYGNTQVIGDGHTTIEQRADNTHAVIWSGSNIRMSDLTIKLAGHCTEITACIFTNSANSELAGPDKRDDRYPENMYVQFCSASNVTLLGAYGLSSSNGDVYLSDEALNYRGVGLTGLNGLNNFCDYDGLACRNLYAGIISRGGGNQHRVQVTDSRIGVWCQSGNDIFNITGHTLYGTGKDGNIVSGTDYVVYVEGHYNTFTTRFYDTQYTKNVYYFDSASMGNTYSWNPTISLIKSNVDTAAWIGHSIVTDLGRANAQEAPVKEEYVGVGPRLFTLSSLPTWNTQFNPSVHNALSGAGVWGNITSNKEWSNDGIELPEVCLYPKENHYTGNGLASVICQDSPSEEAPIEIIIDISNRPIASYEGYWIQFDHRYIAENYTVSFDTNNDGVFNLSSPPVIQNTNAVSYYMNYQTPASHIYRIKISITKALQIAELKYQDAGHVMHTTNYNPNGYVGIVNIGMPSNDAYGRAFLGECGGNLYGNVDMHQNTLKNLPMPVENGDAANKSYVEAQLSNLPVHQGSVENSFVANDFINNKAVSKYSAASGYNTIAGCKAFTVREITNKPKRRLVTLSVPASVLTSYDTSSFRLRIQFSHAVNAGTTFYIKGANSQALEWLLADDNTSFYNMNQTSLTRYQFTRTYEGSDLDTCKFSFTALLDNAPNSSGGIMSSPLGVPSTLLDADGNFNVTLEVECGEEQDLGFVLSLMGDNANTEPSTTLYQHRKTFTVYSEEVKNFVIDNTEDIVIGDVWSLYSNQLGTNLDFYGAVTEVSNTSISVDKIPEDFVSLKEGKLTYIWFPYKPYLNGDQDIGTGSHTRGYDTIACSFGANAEGYNTVAGGKYSHTEGNSTKAGYAGHAQNLETEATGIAAHAQGIRTKATGRQSDANGFETIASGEDATSNGYRTTASGKNSDAGGFNTIASGDTSFTRGLNTEASGKRGFAINNETKALADDTFAAGYKTKATRWAQTVVGIANAEDEHGLFIVGNGSEDDRKNAFVVKTDGSARLAKGGTANDSVVNYAQMRDYVKDYVDTAISNLPRYDGSYKEI